MKYVQKVYKTDMSWWNPESSSLIGDMGFSMCDSEETITEDLGTQHRNAKEYGESLSDYEEEFGDSLDKSFPIIEIHEQIREDDVNDPQEFDASIANLKVDRIIEVYAYCTPRVAAQAGLRRYYKGVKINTYDSNPDLSDDIFNED